ncbi:chagasin [Erwinia sp. OLTSP20]|uniref:protease inhibitor I42 family protein n=1 Tax=unclassified Erwinia TaxID=2622719 RepID=UPI000C185E0A|nr:MULTISPECIES: protease inhibitor I42 family protein [unclassified Erwinia]PIJ49398.1 chagasin [Erwinia sp. OAMSP11]PIJ71074.1 chagasin [Erwinia sp. OLSSP12]PIJ78197.1 chagasin [Erwinia sp. OLCASP19]PIJ79377.1 chagasin [Erwinia sp. OLMTSP26]PIJ83692.1 chagasin [Erwinia sp. OLMDSP33]
MNKAKAIVFGIMMSGAISANASTDITTVTGNVGQDIKISQKSNPTTGYLWMIKDLPDGLIFVSRMYEQSKDCPQGAVGCGGEDEFHFIAEKKGESILKLIYGRPFSKSSWQEKEIKIVIK